MLHSAAVRRRRIWPWIVVGLLGFVVVATIAILAAVPLTSDALRHRMIDTLSKRLDADVAIGDLHWQVFPRLHASGSNLTIRQRGRSDTRPLISIKAFTVEARANAVVRKHVEHVTLEGLEIAIPPSDDKAPGAPAGSAAPAAPPEVAGIVIDTLDADGAQVLTIPKQPGKAPNVWAIHSLRLHNVGAGQAMPFRAALTNAVPPGEIDTTGTFGPWVPNAPGDAALKGTFTFARADLSIFRGIAGTLSAKGSFGGTLDRIEVDGVTDTPDFTVMLGGHPMPLHATYRTIVDGTNGDTILEKIDASFLETSLTAKGSVVDGPDAAKGRTVSLDIQMDKARIEDVLRMAIKADPPMRGALTLTTKFVLPPGEQDVANRLRLDGNFAIARVRFMNYDVQGKINELSRRGRGRADQPQERVVSDMRGRFRLGDGRLALPALTFSVPGAQVELAGRYNLRPESLDFQGQLLLEAKVSQTTTGIKSLLLKAVDPLFNRKGGGSAIPIHIRGRRDDPQFGVDMGRVFKRGGKS